MRRLSEIRLQTHQKRTAKKRAGAWHARSSGLRFPNAHSMGVGRATFRQLRPANAFPCALWAATAPIARSWFTSGRPSGCAR
jgi:hypothetical protein